MWWLGIDKDIENLAKSCLPCLENKSQPAAAPLHLWIWPTTPWKRIHIDFAGPFLDKMFLIVVDAHSKWPEFKCLQQPLSKLLKHSGMSLQSTVSQNN